MESANKSKVNCCAASHAHDLGRGIRLKLGPPDQVQKGVGLQRADAFIVICQELLSMHPDLAVVD
jgi:hypothetical protein